MFTVENFFLGFIEGLTMMLAVACVTVPIILTNATDDAPYLGWLLLTCPSAFGLIRVAKWL